MKKRIIILLLFFAKSLVVSAQGEIDEEIKIFYRNESTFAIGLKSNGWLVGYQYAKRIDGFRKKSYVVDLQQTFHPKEFSTLNNLTHTAYGKNSNAYAFRFALGRMKEFYRKFDKGGVSVRNYYDAGPVVVVQKPVMYLVEYPAGDSADVEYRVETFTQTNRTKTSKAPFYKGWSGVSLVPGLQITYGWEFEFSNTDRSVRAIQLGASLQLFSKELELMAISNNYWYYLSGFVSYKIGKVVGYK